MNINLYLPDGTTETYTEGIGGVKEIEVTDPRNFNGATSVNVYFDNGNTINYYEIPFVTRNYYLTPTTSNNETK